MSPKKWEKLSRDMEKAYEIKSVYGPLDVVFVGRFGNQSFGRSNALGAMP